MKSLMKYVSDRLQQRIYLHSLKKKPQEPGASESEYGKAIFGGESGIRTHGAFPHHQFSRLAP